MVVVGSTGSGKTNLMIRLWAGWFTATLQAARKGRGHRPLLVVLDCKGGRDARRKADRTRRLLHGAGARRVAIWPDESAISAFGAVTLCRSSPLAFATACQIHDLENEVG